MTEKLSCTAEGSKILFKGKFKVAVEDEIPTFYRTPQRKTAPETVLLERVWQLVRTKFNCT